MGNFQLFISPQGIRHFSIGNRFFNFFLKNSEVSRTRGSEDLGTFGSEIQRGQGQTVLKIKKTMGPEV
jgi:hypothetical protein